MRALQPNPKTGFLESHNRDLQLTRYSFDSERKVKFLELANRAIDETRAFPPVDDICKAIGITVSTFGDHLKKDTLFATEWKNVKLRLLSLYTDKLAFKAESKTGTLANLAMLQYLESGTWLRDNRLQISIDNSSDKRILEASPQIIDAEISDNEMPISGAHLKQIDNQPIKDSP